MAILTEEDKKKSLLRGIVDPNAPSIGQRLRDHLAGILGGIGQNAGQGGYAQGQPTGIPSESSQGKPWGIAYGGDKTSGGVAEASPVVGGQSVDNSRTATFNIPLQSINTDQVVPEKNTSMPIDGSIKYDLNGGNPTTVYDPSKGIAGGLSIAGNANPNVKAGTIASLPDGSAQILAPSQGVVAEAARRGMGIESMGTVPGGNLSVASLDPMTQATVDVRKQNNSAQLDSSLENMTDISALGDAHGPRAEQGILAGIAAREIAQQKAAQALHADAAANTTAEMKTFEAKNPGMSKLRGTQEYASGFAEHLKEEQKIKGDQGLQNVDLPGMAESIGNGESALSLVKNTRGMAISNMVQSEIKKTYPHFDFGKSNANNAYKTSTQNQRIIGAVNATLPRLSMLATQAEELKNTPLPAWNAVLKQLSVQTGDPTYTNFMSNRNAIVQEVNAALTGTSQSSDMRVHIELENLREARSPEQLAGSIVNLREALLARGEASTQDMYPLDVVRGVKTQAQWNKEQREKYSGNYAPYSDRVQPDTQKPASQPGSADDMAGFWK